MVCHRLENGETNKSVAEWLNSLPEVQEMLRESFHGHPISEQNMSEWKNGGFIEWQRLQETRELARQIAEDGEVLDLDSDGECFSDRLGLKLAVELAHLMTQLVVEEKDPEKKWQRLQAMNRELSRLRRDDHRAAKLKMERQQHDHEEAARADANYQQMERREKREMEELILGPAKVKAAGEALRPIYGEYGPAIAELLRVVDLDLPAGRRWKELHKGIAQINARVAADNQLKTPANPAQSN